MSAQNDFDMASDSEPDLDDVEASLFHAANKHSGHLSNAELESLGIDPTDVELSPPASQGSNSSPTHGKHAAIQGNYFERTDLVGHRMARSNGGYTGKDKGSSKAEARDYESQKKKPGWSWTNARAQEDYAMALERLQDRKWSTRTFGDLFDERDMLFPMETKTTDEMKTKS